MRLLRDGTTCWHPKAVQSLTPLAVTRLSCDETFIVGLTIRPRNPGGSLNPVDPVDPGSVDLALR